MPFKVDAIQVDGGSETRAGATPLRFALLGSYCGRERDNRQRYAMADIFLSYNRANKQIAQDFVDQLRRR
jgi:hypothetical protein